MPPRQTKAARKKAAAKKKARDKESRARANEARATTKHPAAGAGEQSGDAWEGGEQHAPTSSPEDTPMQQQPQTTAAATAAGPSGVGEHCTPSTSTSTSTSTALPGRDLFVPMPTWTATHATLRRALCMVMVRCQRRGNMHCSFPMSHEQRNA